MPGCLCLDLGLEGLWAKVLGAGPDTAPVWVPLSQEEDLETGLALLDEKLDLGGCASARVWVPDLTASFRNTHLPFDSPKKIREVLPLELAPSLPWPDLPWVTDFFCHPLALVQGRHLVVSASIPESRIKTLFQGLKQRGITPGFIGPRGYTAAVCFADRHRDLRDYLFLFFSPDCIAAVLMAEGRPVMVRALPARGATAEQVQTLADQACTGGGQLFGQALPVPKILCQAAQGQAQDPTVRQLVREVRTLVAGRPDPWEILDLEIPDMSGLALAEAPVAGLMNFCQGPFGPGSLVRKYQRDLMVTAILAGLAALIFFAGLHRDVGILEQEVAAQRRKAAALYQETFPDKPLNPALSPLLLMQSNVRAAEKSLGQPLETGRQARTDVLQILSALSSGIPKALDTELTQLLFSQDHLTITGTTGNFNTVDRLKTALEESEVFTSVAILTAESEKAGDRILFKFRIEVD